MCCTGTFPVSAGLAPKLLKGSQKSNPSLEVWKKRGISLLENVFVIYKNKYYFKGFCGLFDLFENYVLSRVNVFYDNFPVENFKKIKMNFPMKPKLCLHKQ